MSNTPDLVIEQADVIIAGSGGAGMRAAIAAHDAGCKVVLLAKGPRRANHTRMSGGRYNTVSGLNPKDSTNAFYNDTLDSGAGICNQVMARVLADEAMDRAYDLESWGLAWDRTKDSEYYLSMTGGGTFVRTMGSMDEGIGITEVMLHQLHRRMIPVLDFHMLVEAVSDDSGRIVGALVLDIAKGVWKYMVCSSLVIATGGTSQLYETSSGPIINTGDGIAIALRAGADLVDIEFMQFIPISFVYPQSIKGYTLLEPAHYGKRHFDPNAEAGILRNSKGERFVLKHDPVRKEGSTRDVLARAIMMEILEGRGTPEGGVLMHPDPDVFEAYLKERPIYVKRLLENYGEPQARLQAPIQVMPSALYTLGGVRVDDWCRTAVPGLFVGGESAGGVHGANRLGGSSMPDIQVFGRRAGISAAEYAKASGTPERMELTKARQLVQLAEQGMGKAQGIAPSQVKKQVQKLMWDHVGLVRSGEKMDQTCRKFAEIREEVLPQMRITGTSRVVNRSWMEAIELNNMLDIAQAMITASLMRKETRGAHYRTDYPETDAQWAANLIVSLNGRKMVAKKMPLVTLGQAESVAVSA